MTTARQVFEATLIELSKIQAPALKLYEFNYLFNKAINMYINKVYNIYDVNQQSTDDLRVLKSTSYLTPQPIQVHTEAEGATSYLSSHHSKIQSLHGATYEVYLPLDYLHLLNCICVFYVAKTYKCWDAGSYVEIPAERLTADSWSAIINDIYNRPSPTRPYYYIHNRNTGLYLPTNPITTIGTNGLPDGTDMTGDYKVTSNSYIEYKGTVDDTPFTYYKLEGSYYPGDSEFDPNDPGDPLTGSDLTGAKKKIADASDLSVKDIPYDNTATTTTRKGSNFPRSIKLDFDGNDDPETPVSTVEKPIGSRLGNASNVRCEIRYGKLRFLNSYMKIQKSILRENTQDLPAIIVI